MEIEHCFILADRTYVHVGPAGDTRGTHGAPPAVAEEQPGASRGLQPRHPRVVLRNARAAGEQESG